MAGVRHHQRLIVSRRSGRCKAPGATLVSATPRLVAACTTRVSPLVTTSDNPPTPASAPWAGTVGGAAPSCVELAAAYARLRAAIRASAASGDAEEENRLRNRTQTVLARMRLLGCTAPDPTELEP